MTQTKKAKRKFNEFAWAWFMVLPTVIGLIILNIIPLISTLIESFYKTGDFGRNNTFVGFANYAKLLHNDKIWQALYNTLKYVVLEVPISVAISIVIAVLLNRKIKGKTTYRTIFFLPMVVAPAAVAMVWRWLYNSEFGLLNNLFGTHINWISSPEIAIYSIAAIGIWSIIGYNMVLFLAGLQEIPMDYYEAAKIDGASGIKQFFSITLPLLSPTLFFVFVTRTIGALQVFDMIYIIMDRTNPALYHTQSLVYLFYQYSFVENNHGLGATVVIILLILTLIITAIQLFIQKRWVHYN